MTKIKKFVLKEIAKIEVLQRTQKIKAHNGESILNKSGFFKKNKSKGFILDIITKKYWRLNVGENVSLTISNKNLEINVTDAYIKTVGSSISQQKSTHSSQLHIFSFKNKGFRDKGKHYFRSVIPLKNKVSFYNIISDRGFEYEDHISSGLVSMSFDNREFHAYVIEKSKTYLFIDCLTPILLENFLEYSWEVCVAFGYLLGNLAQDEEYIFSYRSKVMKEFNGFSFHQLRDSIKSFYTPVNSNPYAWIESRNIADGYYGKIHKITSVQLSTLCNIIHREQDIKAIVVLIIESISRSLLLMPAGLSVALEGLSEYFYNKDAEKIKPIKDKKLSKLFIKELKGVLTKYKVYEKFSGSDIIESKIYNINSPTNRERLKAPFTYQNIPLTKIDEEVLEYRNDFLHGNINLNPRKERKTFSMDSFEISMRLLTLLNMSIMKMIGYDGYIINHVKTQENGIKKKIDEDYYREV